MENILDLKKHGLSLKFSHTYVALFCETMEEIFHIMKNRTGYFPEKYKSDYVCFLVNRYAQNVFVHKDSEECNSPILYLTENIPFTIPGIDGKYKFMFSGFQEYYSLIKSENFLDILELQNRLAYIIETKKEEQKSFFDYKPGRIKIQDYRY